MWYRLSDYLHLILLDSPNSLIRLTLDISHNNLTNLDGLKHIRNLTDLEIP